MGAKSGIVNYALIALTPTAVTRNERICAPLPRAGEGKVKLALEASFAGVRATGRTGPRTGQSAAALDEAMLRTLRPYAYVRSGRYYVPFAGETPALHEELQLAG
jgi:hypothetical protein